MSLRRNKTGFGWMGAAALAAAAAVTAAGCAPTDSAGGGGEGRAVEYGAPKEEYAAALADMEPVTLVMQSTAPKGAATGRRFEEYAAAVEEWSDGKITFDIAFSNAIAAPTEVDDALADGRLDIGSVLPVLEPSEFPANNVMWDLAFLGRQTPVDGMLQWHGAVLEAAAQEDGIYREYEEKGLRLLLPAFQSGAFGYACSRERGDLASLRGATVATQSRVQNKQVEALGMSPATIPYTEMFESLERGVADCAVTTLTVATLSGFLPSAPYLVIDPEAGFANAGGAIAFGLDRWESLPLAAQQLLYDRLDVLLEVNFAGTWDNTRDGLDEIDEAGGRVLALDGQARAALLESNAETLDRARGDSALDDGDAFVDALVAAEQEWEQKIDALEIPGIDVDYDGFREWYAQGAPDLQPYFDLLWSDAMRERRPS